MPPTITMVPGLAEWTIELETGDTRTVLASSIQSAIGYLPVVTASRGATGPWPTPSLTTLVPATAVIGAPSFTLRVQGAGFGPGSVIVFNGHDESTTLVSPTEVTTGVDMTVWLGPSAPLPVLVRNIDGQQSNALPFTFTQA